MRHPGFRLRLNLIRHGVPSAEIDRMDRVEMEASNIACEEMATGATFDLNEWRWRPLEK